MPRPLIQSLDIDNYRGVSNLTLDRLTCITLLGGLNGSGKTTVLEAIFTILDQENPLGFSRALEFRQVSPALVFTNGAFFRDKSDLVKITANIKNHRYGLAFSWGKQNLPQNMTVNVPADSALDKPTGEGMRQQFYIDGKKVSERLIFQTGPSNFGVHQITGSPASMPNASFFTRLNFGNQVDMVNRFSELYKSGKKAELIATVQKLQPDVRDLMVLQAMNDPILHVELVDGGVVPIALAGDGVQTLLAITMAIHWAEGGALLLDEFEASIHYSALKEIWTIVGELATQKSCQIFAATHSKEAIESALQAASSRNRKNDISYFRLDRINGENFATKYTADDIIDALEEGIEIR